MAFVNHLRQVPGHEIARCGGERPAQCRSSQFCPRIGEADEDAQVREHPDHGIEVAYLDSADDVAFDEFEPFFEPGGIQRGKDVEKRGQVVPGRYCAARRCERPPGGIALLTRQHGGWGYARGRWATM